MRTEIIKTIQKSFFAFFLLAFCVFSSSQAVMIKLSIEELTSKADAIVIGEVRDIQSQWSVDKTVIMSVVKLQILEVIKGEIRSNIALIQYPGGTIGDINLKASDMPTFEPGEKVLVFLKSIMHITDGKHAPVVLLDVFPAYSVYGAAQGKYSVDSEGTAQKSGYTLVSREAEPDVSLPLSDLKGKIKKVLDQDHKDR